MSLQIQTQSPCISFLADYGPIALCYFYVNNLHLPLNFISSILEHVKFSNYIFKKCNHSFE